MISQLLFLLACATQIDALHLVKRAAANGVIPKGTKALTVKQGPGGVVFIKIQMQLYYIVSRTKCFCE
jgi:hypothetical protein